ncbi:MAG: diguanylate cyclase [Candidatus Aminicenantes bacterium]|nr:diguanylate cyclase [Candidatus Aminicenantes bacterium]
MTVADEEGTIVAMNDRAMKVFAADGGKALLGTNVLDCHPEPSRTKLRGLMAERRANVYTIEKNGVKKLIYQAPWTVGGTYRGFVELSLEIPFELPHFVRK